MNNNLNHDFDKIFEEVAEVENIIEKAKTLRERAKTKKEMYKEEIRKADEEIKAGGINPDNDIEEINEKISNLTKELSNIKENLPLDFLRKFENAKQK